MNAERAAHRQIDERHDRRLLITASFVTGAIFSFGASVQSVFVLERAPLEVLGVPLAPGADLLLRFCINLVAVAIISWGPALARILDRSLVVALPLALTLAVCAALARASLQLVFGVHPIDDMLPVTGDALIAFFISLFVMTTSVIVTDLRRTARVAERARQALNDLQQEELRVRRDVADTLHGTMQQRLVMFGAALDEAAFSVRGSAGMPLDAARAESLSELILEVRNGLDRMRENELRTLSATLYPEALSRGLVPALRALTARIPHSISVSFDVTDFPTPDQLGQQDRLLLVRVAEEAISNALRHGDAWAIEVHLCRVDSEIALTVRNFGVPLAEEADFSGLTRFRNRLHDRNGTLRLTPETDGATLRAELSVLA